MNIVQSRGRLIVRRAVMVLAVVELLVVSYVSSFGVTSWLAGRGAISYQTWDTANVTIHLPLTWYKNESRLPGDLALNRFQRWCCDEGMTAREQSKKSQSRSDASINPD